MKIKKIYFAKYLPVEGEFEIGDIPRRKRDEEILHPPSAQHHLNYCNAKLKEGIIEKVKLFLCSRDIKI